MPHITFIHGILNKPPADALLNIWNQALMTGDDGVDLGANGVTTSMVYWADVLYAQPDQAAAHESTDAIPEGAATQIDFGWLDRLSPQDRARFDRLAANLDAATVAADAPGRPVTPSEPVPAAGAAATAAGIVLERVPLPWSLKRKVMESLLRDVHHYLFNTTSTPRPGESYKVQDEIRSRFVSDLTRNRPAQGPHIVVSHSMGTVIAYDCLKRVDACPGVDALVTLGTPLGIDEVRTLLQPGWTPDHRIKDGWSPVDAFPRDKVGGPWANLFDRLDIVDATAPELRSLYMKQGAPVVEDVAVTNRGWWRHDLNQYFERGEVRERLRAMLQI